MVDNIRRAIPKFMGRYPFLLLSVRALWQSFLLILIPASIALLIVIPLASVTKSAGVDVDVVTHRVGFTLLSSQWSGQEIELLHAVSVRRMRVWVDSLEILPKELIEERSGTAIRAGTVRFRGEPHSKPWVEFKAIASCPLCPRVEEVRLTSGSHVELSKDGDTLTLGLGPRLVPQGRIQGEISLNGPVDLVAQDCQVLDNKGGPLAGLEERQQQRFRLTPGLDPVTLDSSGPVKLELDVTGEEKDFVGTFSDLLDVKDVKFPPGNGESPVPIVNGSVVFRGVEKATLNLEASFLAIPSEDVLNLVTIGAKSGALEVSASGRVGSLKAGRVPDPEDEYLPSLLEWIYDNERLGIIIGILVWVSGTVFGALKLVEEMKKRRG
jgi:hypothetical protein